MKSIISAATAKYFNTLINLIYSLNRSKNMDFTFIFYDLGLNASQRTILDAISLKVNFHIETEIFNPKDYPLFIHPENGSYAWKPIIIHHEFLKRKGSVLWLDSASLVHSDLSSIWEEIKQKGLYIPISGSGTLESWTHADTFRFFDPTVEDKARNRCGGLCGFNYENQLSRQLLEDWKDYASIEECIIPDGSNRTNHRHDQSILTILLNLPKYSTLYLTDDEVNISSKNPIKTITVRNKLSEGFPLRLLWLANIYFWFRFRADILINEIKK